MNIDIQLILTSLPEIAKGLGLTMQLLVLSLLFATVLGVLLALMRVSGTAALAMPAMLYTYVVRGTPMLVQLFLFYYGLSQFEAVRNSVLWPILREPFWCALLALSLNGAAYIGEVMRGAIQGVDRGVLEASRALGLSRRQRFTHVTLPIAVRLALPGYGNQIVSQLKSTALVSLVTLNDVTGIARDIVARTFAPYEIFLSAAAIYLVITYAIQYLVKFAEKRVSRYVRT